jgi:hypothetical protein
MVFSSGAFYKVTKIIRFSHLTLFEIITHGIKSNAIFKEVTKFGILGKYNERNYCQSGD